MSLMQTFLVLIEIFWFYGNKHQTNELVVKHNSLFLFYKFVIVTERLNDDWFSLLILPSYYQKKSMRPKFIP
jgi:hypothetical protein